MGQTNDSADLHLAGPFRTGRRIKGHTTDGGLPGGPRLGRVYCALHRWTGRRAAVAISRTPEDYRPREAWTVSIRGNPQQEGAGQPFLSVMVTGCPGGPAPVAELRDGVEAAAELLDRVALNPEGAAHLVGGRVFLPWMRRGAAQAALGILAVCLLGWSLTRVSAADAAEPGEAPGAAAPTGPVVAAGLGEAVRRAEPLDRLPSDVAGIAQPIPPGPMKGQRKPDKSGRCPSRQEVVINGGCWVPLKMPPPCDNSWEHEGTCYQLYSKPNAGQTSEATPESTEGHQASRE